MKHNTWFKMVMVIALTVALSSGGLLVHGARAQEESAQGSALDPAAPGAVLADLGDQITYQGRLMSDDTPADGAYNFQFKLFTAASAGTQVGDTVTVEDVTVSDGLFTVKLDFGNVDNVFDGQALWLEVSVAWWRDISYTTLSPRQMLTAAPYAHSLRPGAHIESTTGSALMVQTRAELGAALYADATSTTGASSGVMAHSHSPLGFAGLFTNYGGTALVATASVDSGVAHGVQGQSNSPDGVGVYGSAPTVGVEGHSSATSGHAYGMWGESASTTGRGVLGFATAATGATQGVHGRSDSPEGSGVFGNGNATDGANCGVRGESNSTLGRGVFGHALATSGTNFGVYGATASASGYAGYFSSRVHVNGTLSKASGSFKIDHPLDPENRYLYHSFVESPDMMNIYNGNVTLDEKGEAWIEMPDWFEAVNGDARYQSDYRYQLTPIGGWAPLYVAREIEGNRFQIAGGEPGMKVSWQVTGIRHDPYAEANRIQVVEDKPEDERGTYLHPEVYGQPKEMGLDYQRNQ
ncbi:MAG: hypothetical protein JXA93_22985 [Anaerolineae bacterium]|nr:hypothetical protein [Anaerolineae bacterium]